MSESDRCFEDFEIGKVLEHRYGRTITSADNIWFSLLTQNQAAIHINHQHAAATGFKKPLVNSALTLSIVTGQSTADLSHNVFANLGWDDVRLPNPVFEGDTLYSQSEVIAARESDSNPEVGIVTVLTRGYNQEGTIVISFKRTVMIYRRGHAPKARPHMTAPSTP